MIQTYIKIADKLEVNTTNLLNLLFNMHKSFFLSVIAVFALSISGCSNNEKNESNNSNAGVKEKKDTAAISKVPVETGNDVVLTNEGLMVKEMHRNEMRVFGKYVEGPISDIKNAINKVVPEMMGQIMNRQLILSGTLMVIYTSDKPSTAKAKLFLGIPVKVKKPIPGYEFLEFPAGDYFKATVNASPGESTKHWKKYLAELEKQGHPFDFPMFEYYSDSRNAEMTTTIAQTSLLVKKK
ncbi:MAG: GyrI-like domain-containing protein [Flavobacterium stagni]